MTEITILSYDVSHNCLGRAYMLAEVLDRRFEVEIVGPAAAREGVWKPVRNSRIPIKWIAQDRHNSTTTVKRLVDMTEGNIIYAIKPQFTSFGVGLLARMLRSRPLVVDIDDWELGFYLNNPRWKLNAIGKRHNRFNNIASTWILEKMVRRADAITTSSSFLQRRFGGLRIPHVRDTAVIDPARFDRDKIRLSRGWQDSITAIFLGTPAVYKGIDTMIEAARLVNQPGFRLVIAGVPDSSLLWKLGSNDSRGTTVEIIGELPIDEAPELLAAADFVVIPQLGGPATTGQVPAKLVDAMALGKAVVASEISDIPQMLSGCGLLSKPGDVIDLAAKMTVLADDPELRERLGGKARDRCLERYSFDAIEEPLAGIFNNLSVTGRAA